MAVKREIKILMPDLDEQGQVFDNRPKQARLELSTDKWDRGIVSIAHVVFVGDVFKTFAMGRDFSKVYLCDRNARGTQKNIDVQHNSVFTDRAVEIIKAEVRAFYAAKKPVAA